MCCVTIKGLVIPPEVMRLAERMQSMRDELQWIMLIDCSKCPEVRAGVEKDFAHARRHLRAGVALKKPMLINST